MDEHKHLIIIKGTDKTAGVSYVRYCGGFAYVGFNNTADRRYKYSRKNVRWHRYDKTINCSEYFVFINGKLQKNVESISASENLPKLEAAGCKNIGVVTPYRNQTAIMNKILPYYCDADTVHKFQGREKEVIILSSADNKIGI